MSVLSVCPVCDVRALWPNGWTDQDETWRAGRPRRWPHCVRWGPISPSPKGGMEPPIFGPYLLWPNGWMDQDATWTLGMEKGLGPDDFVLDGDSASPPLKGRSPPPQFSAHVHCGQTAGCIKIALGIEVGLGPGYIVLDWDPAGLPKKGRSPLPNFRPISIVAKRLDASRCHSYGGRPQPRRLCVIWGPRPSPEKGGGAPPQF